MPTAYTAKLMEEGQSFPAFVMTCARAFGALITMRDDPLDAEIPENFKPSNYHVERLSAAKADLARLEKMGDAERVAFGKLKRDQEIEARRAHLDKDRSQNDRLDEARAQVEKWEPPTPEHVGLKDFMLEQINISRHDLSWAEKYLAEAAAKTPAQYYADAVAGAKRQVEWHTEEQEKEAARARERTEWVKALRESLAANAS